MHQEPNEIERLDWAARADTSESVLWIFKTAAGALCTLLAVLGFGILRNSEAAAVLDILAGVAATATVSLLFRWRYSLHALAIFMLLVAAVTPSLNIDSRLYHPKLLAWFVSHGHSFILIVSAYATWRAAIPFAMVAGHAWFAETAQVRQWLDILKNRFTLQPVLEISTKSFWRGHNTYRLLYLGNCWAIAEFPRDDFEAVKSFRIRNLGAVRLMRLEDGKLDLEIDGHPINGVQLPPNVRENIATLIASGV